MRRARRYSRPLRRFEYIDIQWLHHFGAEPTYLVAELDELRMEIRKLEFFRDGRVGYAYSGHAAYGTELGVMPVPLLRDQFRSRIRWRHDYRSRV
ncbi:DUF6881 domain-containing protein [Cupriavidus pauculus]